MADGSTLNPLSIRGADVPGGGDVGDGGGDPPVGVGCGMRRGMTSTWVIFTGVGSSGDVLTMFAGREGTGCLGSDKVPIGAAAVSE